MKAVLIGSVSSSKITLETMIDIGFPVELVLALDEEYSDNVSGYQPIHQIAIENGIRSYTFKRINEEECIRAIQEVEPDYIFIIGLSQLVGKPIIDSAKKGVVGFHPTPLPKFRGRAAIPWQIILDVEYSKISLFFIDEGMDSGPIIAQEEYLIGRDDYAYDVISKIEKALHRLLRRTLPRFLEGTIEAEPQVESEATYLLKRTPEDGRIIWWESAETIHRLVRATSHPYPGAFSMYKGKTKVIFWKADLIYESKYIGIPGQIASVRDDYVDIVCRDGVLLRVYEYSIEEPIRFIEGHKFL